MVYTLSSGSMMNYFQCVMPVKKKNDPGVMYDDVSLSPKRRCFKEEVPLITNFFVCLFLFLHVALHTLFSCRIAKVVLECVGCDTFSGLHKLSRAQLEIRDTNSSQREQG